MEKREDNFYLNIKIGKNTMQFHLREHRFSCWDKFAHSHISYNGERSPDNYEDIKLDKVFNDVN